mmetsp:Transcript_8399/g.12774  ORF Transcript_8399/g.12774 Transcript_8399/m.12774 type:complete len:128 (-) Transcript_8399:139-522(-)|eukprot:CAMPEP_0201552704 /NCGR_PEP_ID=MMETSP0173_2-20130828/16938_1 /ASSEMBLY_ACC=CAM_ASM_000268 /TAXON_ID=218659 /ORGANISM="Vexillifera sp., Strain DIVA3 564/2" /LENGTH=127 /DNA_ID=CAMNT_0047963223 /DNA_START=34 /DNA_END=417 /DNA_ORIENTATION=-
MSGGAPFENIGKAFVKAYYQRFDSDRKTLAGLYGKNSMLTFEGTKLAGVENILKKLASIGAKSAHRLSKVDCQPIPTCNGVLVQVVGDISIDGGNPVKFSQSFTLMPTPGSSGNYYCLNDIMRLNYC